MLWLSDAKTRIAAGTVLIRSSIFRVGMRNQIGHQPQIRPRHPDIVAHQVEVGEAIGEIAHANRHVDDRDPISLTLTESTLLYLLAANSGAVVDREDIITSIWDGVVDIESNAVDSHIRDLRVKLGDTWPSSKFIETIPGKGYRWRHVSNLGRPN